MISPRWPSEIIFVVPKFVATPEHAQMRACAIDLHERPSVRELYR